MDAPHKFTTSASHAARRGQSMPIDCLQPAARWGCFATHLIIITWRHVRRLGAGSRAYSIGTAHTRRTQGLGRLGMCSACNSPLYWFQRFMVANVALLGPYSTCEAIQYLRCCALAEGRRPTVPVLVGAISLQAKDMTALCMHRANHENAAGPQEPKDDRLKVLGDEMQDGKSPCSSLRGKSSVGGRACEEDIMLRPSLFGCPPFNSPHRRWSYAGARHVVNGLAAQQYSELRRQTSGCSLESDSARLPVCTGALCDHQPASATLPCPTTCSLATDHAVLSGSTFAWAAGPSRCRTLGCGGISSGPCQLNKCATTHIINSCRNPPNHKNSMRACSSCILVGQKAKHLNRAHKLAMPISWERL
jgi:hypothetical protein